MSITEQGDLGLLGFFARNLSQHKDPFLDLPTKLRKAFLTVAAAPKAPFDQPDQTGRNTTPSDSVSPGSRWAEKLNINTHCIGILPFLCFNGGPLSYLASGSPMSKRETVEVCECGH